MAGRHCRWGAGIALAVVLGWPTATLGAPPEWTHGPDMATGRVAFVSARLSDGRILAAGGTYNSPAASATAELLDSAGSAWSPTGSMSVARRYFSGAVLAGDRVLVAGGAGNGVSAAQASAELWTPTTGAFAATGPMNVARQSFSLTALPDGRALAAGGSPDLSSGAGSPTTELYDPLTNSWSLGGALRAGRLGHTGTLLADCHVLIVGDNPTSELYNYKTGMSAAAGSATDQRSYHTATLLADGRVLIAGGVSLGNVPQASATVYDPATGHFTAAGTMSQPRTQAVATRLADGRVLVAGGLTGSPKTTSASADIYDPATNSWSAAPGMLEKADSGQAQVLADGRAVVIGGDFSGGIRTQIFDPGPGGPVVTPPAPDCSKLPGPGEPGTGGTQPGSGETPATGTGGKAKVTVLGRTPRVDRRGRARLRLRCSGASTCRGRLRLRRAARRASARRVVGTRRFSIKPGRHTVRVRLNRAGRRALARSRKRRLRVVVIAAHAKRRTLTLRG